MISEKELKQMEEDFNSMYCTSESDYVIPLDELELDEEEIEVF
jgi:hypothetical protein